MYFRNHKYFKGPLKQSDLTYDRESCGEYLFMRNYGMNLILDLSVLKLIKPINNSYSIWRPPSLSELTPY